MGLHPLEVLRKMQRPELHRFTEPMTLLLLAGVCYVMFFHGLSAIGLI
jgi:hypothetical protein